jgi:EF hand domain-containing protein
MAMWLSAVVRPGLFRTRAPLPAGYASSSPNRRSGTSKEKLMNKLLAAALIASIPLAGVTAEGNKTPPATPAGQSGTFETLDANKDGRISMPEASADPRLVEIFSTADKNGDGYLDNAEFDSSTVKPRK